MNQPHCPLCTYTKTRPYSEDKKRLYFQCAQCELVFADPLSWPSVKQEKSEYDLHENNLEDAGYNQFLGRIVAPLNQILAAQSRILDFGCGPAPALAKQLTELGHQVALYDIFYYPEATVLKQPYNAVVMTEVIEHLHQPYAVIEKLWQQIEPNGVLAVMTQRVINQEKFNQWPYKNDPTHVCFYTEATFSWLADQLNAQLSYHGRDMVFLIRG